MAFRMLVFCVLLRPSSPLKKCFNHVVIILIQNTSFDTANAGKENVVFVFVIGAVESKSRLQVQNGFTVSWNEYFTFLLRRWLKFTHSYVRYFIPLRLWHWKILFGADLINLRMLSSIWLKLVKFRIAGSSLFQSIMVDGKNFLLKKLCLIFIKGYH